MLHSLKAKFILAFGTLIVALFAAVGLFLVQAKTTELSADISSSTESFAQFTVKRMVEVYEQYLDPGNFVPFQREMSAMLRKNQDISGVEMSSYGGIILYNSRQEQSERYTGTVRTVTDPNELQRIQSNKMSLLLENGRVVYVKIDENKNSSFVDFNEDPVNAPAPLDRLVNIVVPYNSSYAVTYDVSYATMDARLAVAKLQIELIALVGFLLALMLSIMLSVSITNPLKALKEGAIRIAGGDFTTRVPVKTKDEVGLLAGTFNQMAVDLAAAVEVKIYKERVTKELEIAAHIQADLLPKEKVELPSLDLAGGLDPATEVGGDAFDFIQMNNGEHLIYLGDVSGHGVPAGMISSIANALLYAMRGETDLKTLATHLNAVIQKKSSNNMFMTMALTKWNEQSSQLTCLNAGHLPILHYDAAVKKVSEIKIPGIAFGMIDDVTGHVNTQDLSLKANDVVVLYSDGFPEAQNERGEQYGMQRLRRIVQQAGDDLLTAEGIKNAVFADVMQFIGKKEHLDDITIVVMKRK
jgi:serine phosphatase RsbU (regulator of sigma subunit)